MTQFGIGAPVILPPPPVVVLPPAPLPILVQYPAPTLPGQPLPPAVLPARTPPIVVLPVPGPQGADGLSDGGTLTVIAGAILSGHRAVRPQPDGSVIYATNADIDDATRPFWLTLGAALTDEFVQVRTFGPVVEPSWSWTDDPIFLGVNGVLTQTPPTAPAAAFLVQVASPDGPTGLFWNPRTPYAL